MKIVFYCQHVLGLGHFFRSLTICSALSSHDLVFVTGGMEVDAKIPGHVRKVNLPDLMMDADFKGFYTTDPSRTVEEVKAKRQKILLELLLKEKPDLFIVELYPFGRKAFRFELDPLFSAVKKWNTKVVCSLRDILVEKGDVNSYEKRVVDTLNRHFDALLIHSDDSLFRLDQTFSRLSDIRIPLFYTGFVTPKPLPGARTRIRKELDLADDERLIVASAGSGTVGAPLLLSVARAFPLIKKREKTRLIIFSGPFMDDKAYGELSALSSDRVTVARFTGDFLSHLAAADLSVSMGGYNTTMNILSAEVSALIYPFGQNREQRMRALALAERGQVAVLAEEMLSPGLLAEAMDRGLEGKSAKAVDIDLDGAGNTARWIDNWIKRSR